MSGSFEGDYSEVADQQLDELERGDADLFNAVLDACELVLNFPNKAQSMSSAITTDQGVTLRLAVAGHPPYKVFWTRGGPRVEAVFPYSGSA